MLWIGTINGINLLNFNQQAFKYYTGVLNNNAVSNICYGGDGILWFKTRLGPIKFDCDTHTVEAIWPGIFTDQNFSNVLLNTFYVGGDGCMWSGTENSGLQRFNPGTGVITTYTYQPGNRNSLPGNTVTAVFAARDGTVWVGTGGGRSSLHPVTREIAVHRAGKPGQCHRWHYLDYLRDFKR